MKDDRTTPMRERMIEDMRIRGIKETRIFSITTGSSMLAMILTWPPQLLQISMSMLNTRFRRCAQVMAARRSAGVVTSGASSVRALLPLPRLAGVTCARCALLGAKTPWKRVRLTRGLGTKATSRAMKSSGSNMTCVVPPRYGVCGFPPVAQIEMY